MLWRSVTLYRRFLSGGFLALALSGPGCGPRCLKSVPQAVNVEEVCRAVPVTFLVTAWDCVPAHDEERETCTLYEAP